MEPQKTEQPDHSGLQFVIPEQAPEVVPESDLIPVERRSSIHSPEAFTPPAQNKNRNDYYGPRQGHFTEQTDERPYYAPPEYEGGPEKHGEQEKKQKRVCGLRRAVFFWMLGLVILLIIIAAVLGGVLGSVLHGSSSPNKAAPKVSSTPPLINSKTGISVIDPNGTPTLYQYYQDPQGRIIENTFVNGNWSASGNDVPAGAVVATGAQSGSPLAATSWSSNGALFRQIFYLDENGLVMTSNTTSTTWPTPFNILTDDAAAPNTVALAVVSDTNADALNGIRVYYASSTGMIRECGTDFSGDYPLYWFMWMNFTNSDSNSGVASVISNNHNHLYLRNSSTNGLQQWTWDYTVGPTDTVWTPGVRGPTTITSGSDIAAANDGASTDHIFYEVNNELTRSLYYGQGFSNLETLGPVARGSKLSATYDTSYLGAMVYYQEANNASAIGYQEINRSGQKVRNGTVT